MPERVGYLDIAKEGLSEIDEIIKKGNEQADTRKAAIQTIHEMCDTLQLSADIVSRELSASIIEFNRLRNQPEALHGYFERTAFKFSNPSLRQMLHEGSVCGELHALGDRFRQPFSDVATGSLSVWDNVKTLFTRSNRMSMAVEGLYQGEIDYLGELVDFLNEIRDCAEYGTSIDEGEREEQVKLGDDLTVLMRNKRQVLQDQIRDLKHGADVCVEDLH